MGPHQIVNPPELGKPVGFSHGILAGGGRILFLGGQNGGVGRTSDLAKQFDQALERILAVLAAAGGRPEHIVQLNIYVTDRAVYAQARRKLGEVWRRRMGTHYPAMALLVVKGLWERKAKVELDGIAVVPYPAIGGAPQG